MIGRPRKYAERQPCGECGRPGLVQRQWGKIYFSPICSTCKKLAVKREVLTHYGNGIAACVKCAFDNIDALTIDHMNDDGAAHRRTLGGGRNYGGGFYYWLRARGFPVGYQTLCFNCNGIKEVERRRLTMRQGVNKWQA